MKKKIILMGFVLIVLLMTTSCITISRTGEAAPFAYTEVHPDKIKAEMNFHLQEKRRGQASAWYIFWFWKVAGSNKFAEVKGGDGGSIFGHRIAVIKSAALYDALGDFDYDMLVNPQYYCEIRKYLFGIVKSYKVEVKGYGATIKTLYQEKEKNYTVAANDNNPSYERPAYYAERPVDNPGNNSGARDYSSTTVSTPAYRENSVAPCPVVYDDCTVRGKTITMRWTASTSSSCGISTRAYLQVRSPRTDNYEVVQTLSGTATSVAFDYSAWVFPTQYVYARIVLENEKGSVVGLSKVYDIKNNKWIY